LIAALGISQVDYPRLITIDGDTLVAFRPKQVTKMNIVFLQLDECKELKNSIESENNLLMEQDSICSLQKDNLIEQQEILTRINDEKTTQVEILTEENKKQSKKIKRLKKSRTLFTLGGVILGSAATYIVTLLLK